MNYIPRDIERELLSISAQFPVTILTGPRQTGKSTLLTHLFPEHSYLTMDDSTLRRYARLDPSAFVDGLSTPVIIDEVQYVPEILPFIKMRVDKNRKNGEFILTGSQVFSVMAGATESLAGRACLFELLPFSINELKHLNDTACSDMKGCFNQILRGFYPVPNIEKTNISYFYEAYLSLYIERDLRQIVNIKDITTFEGFLHILAGKAGNLLNMADLASNAGISQPTCKSWLSILENSRIIYLLRPWFKNRTKRYVKSPKIYFTDTGLLAYLLKYSDSDTLMTSSIMGNIFENMVIMEFIKNKFNKRLHCDIFFYRDSNGVEVDLLIDEGTAISLYEIKAAKTIRPDMAKSFKSIVSQNGSREQAALRKYLLSFHENQLQLDNEVKALPWSDAMLIVS